MDGCTKQEQTKMDEQKFQLSKTDIDLDTIYNRLITCICELQSRRNEVTLLKTTLDETNRMKAALENDAQNFQREMTELRDQLKIALDALNQKEAIRNGFMENAARQNVQLEAVTNDNERLNVKIETSQVKIMELTRDNSKLLEQLKALQGAQNPTTESTDRIWKAMDVLNGHLQKLEADHLVLSETAESSNKIAEEAASALVNSRNNLMRVQNENMLLKRRIVELEAKIITISSDAALNKSEKLEEDSFDKFEEHLKTVTEELELEREINVKLRDDMDALMALQNCLTNDGNIVGDSDGNIEGVGEQQPDTQLPDESNSTELMETA
ncbi:tropomyosin-1-like [Armigeres subalbatus]|uniref:tropomyosin-1-like n=1 Tax=Armigeres subalbatus TaxID=124917 RepID=UPI002ED4183C